MAYENQYQLFLLATTTELTSQREKRDNNRDLQSRSLSHQCITNSLKEGFMDLIL
jgi:hypothetical protein